MSSTWKRPNRWFTAALLAAIALGGFVYFRSGNLVREAGAEAPDATADRKGIDLQQQTIDLSGKQLEAIAIEPVELYEFHIIKDALGSISYNENLLVQVFSPYAGRIVDTFVNIGDDVKAGAPLFTIDSPDLLQAESTLLASAGVLELQNRTLNRVRQLLRTGGGAQRDVDQATSDQQTAEGNFKAARDAVRIFGKNDAEIDKITADRKVDSILIVRSSVDGQVTARSAAPGLYVQPGSASAPLTLANLAIKWMVANVIETDAPAFRLGQPVQARVPAFPDSVFRGRITTLGSSIDSTSHRLMVRSEIEDPNNLLRPGMLATFSIEVGRPVMAPAVKLDAVIREGDGSMVVWVTDDRQTFKRKFVKTGMAQDGRRQITEGLRPGELVVTNGAILLSNKLANAAGG